MKETFLRQYFCDSGAALCVVDSSLKTVIWNKPMERLTGLAEKDVVGKLLSDILHLPEPDEHFLQDALQGRRGSHFSHAYHLTAKAADRLQLVSFYPVEEQDEVCGCYIKVESRHQVTELEMKVAESEVRFHVMADSAPVLLWMSDTTAKCIYFNKTWLDFTGKDLAEEYGKGWVDGVHPEDTQRCLEVYLSSFKAKQNFSMEYRLRRFDGVYRWVLDRASPRYFENGDFAGFIGSCIDITDIKDLQYEREQLLQLETAARSKVEELLEVADRANRLKDEFLATLSHELRTPLNAIMGWSEILRDFKLPQAEVDQALEAIDRNAHSQKRIIEDLLDVSSIITGKMQLKIELIDLDQIISDSIKSVKFAADAKNIQLNFAGNRIDRIEGDAVRIQQVLWNLLINAIKFTGRNGLIDVTLERIGMRARIAVRDNGEGIDEHFLPYVFDRFRQADSRLTRKHGGLGLGLAIVRHFIELHGGDVQVASEGVGKGTVFSFSLPYKAG